MTAKRRPSDKPEPSTDHSPAPARSERELAELQAKLAIIDVEDIESVALRRIIEEVRNDDPPRHGGYDRIYNRHNRS